MFTRAQSLLVFLLLPLLVIAQDQVVSPSSDGIVSPSPEELVTSSSSTEEFVLPVCLADNACAAELRTFPSAADDSSGFSGETPLYDEYFKVKHAFSDNFSSQPLTSFDFTGEPESTTRHSLCICPNNSTCEDVEERVMRLDSSLSLTLCSSVKVGPVLARRRQRPSPFSH